MLESDLENLQAQLSRFQLQVTSVTEDIVSMESKLNSTIMTLKKTLVSEAYSCKMCTRSWFNLLYILLFSLFALSFVFLLLLLSFCFFLKLFVRENVELILIFRRLNWKYVQFSFLSSMQASVNQVKAAITELETAGEEQIDDISSLVII